ncbi:zinc-ribbon domain-containing protein [Maribacter sp. ACAM166]|nr:zinc-ribbon domain-containing protein [Maribacter sp. ACAM166]
MILFFGTRPGKQESKQLIHSSCTYCHQQGTLMAVTQRNYVHFFWIKFFKISTITTVQCMHCKRAFYENEFTSEIKSAVKNK